MLIDIAQDQAKDLGSIKTGSFWDKKRVSLNSKSVLSYGAEAYLVDHDKLEMTPYAYDFKWLLNLRRGATHTFLLSRGEDEDNWGLEITTVDNASAALQSYHLPLSPDGQPQSIWQLVEKQGEVYAVGKTASHQFRLYHIGGSEPDTRFVSDLPDSPRHSSIQSLYNGQDGGLLMSTPDTVYRLKQGTLTALGDKKMNPTPDGYVGNLSGVDLFYWNYVFMMPALERSIQISWRLYSIDENISPFVLTDQKYYVLAWKRDHHLDSVATVSLFSGDLTTTDTFDVEIRYPMARVENDYRPTLTRIGDKLYYAVPTSTAGRVVADWYYFDLNSGNTGRVDALKAVNHAGNRALVFEETLYFVSNRNESTQLMRWSREGSPEVLATLQEKEDLIAVARVGEALLAMTENQLLDVERMQPLATIPDGKQFEQMKDVGGELFVEMSDAEGLGFYSYEREADRFIALATGFDWNKHRQRESTSNAVIGRLCNLIPLSSAAFS
jgi:hypothetical protein